MRVRWNKGGPQFLCAANRDTSACGSQWTHRREWIGQHSYISSFFLHDTHPKGGKRCSKPHCPTQPDVWTPTACQSISTKNTIIVSIPMSMREIKSTSKGNSNVWDLRTTRKLLRVQVNSSRGLKNLLSPLQQGGLQRMLAWVLPKEKPLKILV